MDATIIRIGNSRGVRLPKALLAQTGLHGKVELTVKGDGLVIKPAKEPLIDTAAMSEAMLAKDWNKLQEDTAWAHLQ